MPSTHIRKQGEDEDESPSAAGSRKNNGRDDIAKAAKHDPTADAATPETGDDDADHSTGSGKFSYEEQELPLLGGEEENPIHDSQSPSPQTAAQPSARRLGEGIVSDDDTKESKELFFDYSQRNFKVQIPSNDEHRSDTPQKDEDLQAHPTDDDPNVGDSDSAYSATEDSTIWKFRMTCGKAVNNEYVQIGVIILIILNALMMGLATFDFVMEDPEVDAAFAKIDRGFLVLFTIEVLMQLIYLGLTLFADGWLLFDLLIVVFSWSFESLQIVRAFRIFRAFRLITRLKPLRDLVLAIGAVMPRMYAIAALLLLIFYIFAVLFTELFSELPLSDNYFTSLGISLFTCMEMMTLEWGNISREVMTHLPWAWAPFCAFIMITGFIVFNLIIAVVCDAVSVTKQTVRQLDGFESDNPQNKLNEAQERIDLLHCHMSDMMRTQENVQNLIETMASELLNLEAERMKAEHREAELRIKVSRRHMYQEEMQSQRQIQSLERTYIQEKEKRDHERKLKELQRKASLQAEEESIANTSRHSRLLPSPLEKKKAKRRNSAEASTRSTDMRQLSYKRNASQELSNQSLDDTAPPRGITKDTSKESVRSGLSSSTARS